VLGDRLGRDGELGGDLAGRQLAISHEREDAAALRLRQGVQDRVGGHEPIMASGR